MPTPRERRARAAISPRCTTGTRSNRFIYREHNRKEPEICYLKINRAIAIRYRQSTLIVTAGPGWTQCWGEEKVEIRPGDVITCPAGKKHWHGATDKTAMTHITIQESKNGKNVEWLEKITDEQYLAAPRANAK